MSFQQRANIFEDLRFRVRFNDITANSSSFETPNLKSFNISKQRGNIVSSASITMRMRSSDLSSISASSDQNLGGTQFNNKSSIIIEGKNKTVNSNWVRLFTGMVKTINIRRDLILASTYIVDIQAVDIMHVLQERTYTRRVKDNGMGVFAVITGIEQKSLMGRYQQASGGGINRPGGRLNGSSSGFNSSSLKSSALRKSSMKKSGTIKKSDSSPGSGILSFLSDTFSLSPRGNINSSTHHKWFDRGHFKQSSSSGGSGTSSGSGVATAMRISPPVIMLEPNEEWVFKCPNDTICAPPAEGSRHGNAYTWSVLHSDFGILIDGPGGSPLNDNKKDTDFPASDNGSVWYRHLAIGKQYNEVILTDNINSVSASAVIIGFPVHKHADMGEGGPAFGTYAPITDEES